MAKKRSAFFTLEDIKIAFSLFCCVLGIGTLGMPSDFSRAGPTLGFSALIFMTYANIYASVACSKVMLLAPSWVKTFSDLGEWSMGKAGRYAVLVSQMSVCILTPCVFLVLGGNLLQSLFPETFSQSIWIIFMALSILPLCLTPTLKESAGATLAGCAGTLVADSIAVVLLVTGMSGHPPVPKPDLNFEQVAGAFGNLCLAFGAGIIIPSLQNEHSEPTRMPRLVFCTMALISCLFMALAFAGYSAVGCQISGNLLFSIFPDSSGLTALGFRPNKGAAVVAFMFMQMHVSIAFFVFLHPAFFCFERLVLGMHKQKGNPNSTRYNDLDTPSRMAERSNSKRGSSKYSLVIVVGDENEEELVSEYRRPDVIVKYVALRMTIISILVVVAIVCRSHLNAFMDFIGASCQSICCIVLPISFYLKKMWPHVPLYEKIPAIITIIACSVLACYVTYTSGRDMLFPAQNMPPFPFCAPEFESKLYYNASAIVNE